MLREFGGTPTYIKRNGDYMRLGVLREFDGSNVTRLARRYGTSTDTIRRIIREQREEQ